MEVLQARIDSFKKAKRVKNPNKPSSTITVRWPHPLDFKANPETLAEAGFFYDPSYDDPDNVTCYVCDKELGGWEVDDDPHAIHWKKCGQTCCWAIVRCGLQNDIDKSGRYIFTDKTRIPTHKLMEKARFDTFDVGKGWIHDQVQNHGANSKMMARAGFVYTPQQSNDDLVTCLYCDTSLSGWDANDDPMEEHRRRENKSDFSCPFFFTSIPEPAPTNRAGSQSLSSKPPSKSQSKPPTRSTSKSKHQDILLPTKTHDGDPDNDSDPSPSTTAAKATTKTPRKGRSTSGARKSSAKTPKSKARSSSKSSLRNVAEGDEDEDETALIAESAVKKKARSRSKSVVRSEPEQTIAEDEIQKKPLRSRSKAKATDDSEDIPNKTSRSKVKASEGGEVPPKPSRTRSKNKVIEPEQEQEPVTAVKHRSTSRTASKSKAKAHPEPFEESDSEPATVAPKKASTKLKDQTPTDPFSDEVVLDDYIPPPSSPPLSKLTPLFIPKRTMAAKTSTPPEEEDEAVLAEKEKRKRGRPKKVKAGISVASLAESVEVKPSEDTPVSRQVGTHDPLYPVSNQPSTEASAEEKSAAKARPNPKHGDPAVKQKMAVVEISSDEEPAEGTKPEKDGKKVKPVAQSGKENTHGSTTAQVTSQPQFEPEVRVVFSQSKKKPKRSMTVEIVQSIKPGLPSVPRVSPIPDVDAVMSDIEPETNNNHVYPAPSTPRRPLAQTPPKRDLTPPPITESTSRAVEPPQIPALSRLPFTPLHALTEAELDMTVEEWIRYQMEVEYDKFRRDGERELQRFRNQAEEVRKAIEGL